VGDKAKDGKNNNGRIRARYCLHLTRYLFYIKMAMKEGVNLPIRNIKFPDELYERLKAIAKQKGLTVSAIIKIACDEYATKQGK